MNNENKIRLFQGQSVRTHWDEEQENWFFSIIDVVSILTEQQDYQGARNYWKVLKHRLAKEGNETVTNCNRLKVIAKDGKMQDCRDWLRRCLFLWVFVMGVITYVRASQ